MGGQRRPIPPRSGTRSAGAQRHRSRCSGRDGHRHGRERPALPGGRFNLRPGGCPGAHRSCPPLNAHTCPPGPLLARGGGSAYPARPPLPGSGGAPLPEGPGSAGSSAPPPSRPLPARSALPGTRASGHGSLDWGPGKPRRTRSPRRGCAVRDLSVPRKSRTTQASPRGEANIHPAALVLTGRGAGQTLPERLPTTSYGASAPYGLRERRGRTRDSGSSRVARPQGSPRKGAPPGAKKEDGSPRRLAEPRRRGNRAPQRKAS
ncbi:uncharacterized protein LOC113950711 [Corapipo altera]|uniref:uncharacterized protein LOC113950711 n=1 Tax=Corapipo altera TaxID=415028 RepID=UPI000FD647EB|nr:uncharacterized protein LOC113950711 [Corapipo altera]